MSVQIISKSPVNFKKNDLNLVQFNNGKKFQQMPDETYQDDMFLLQAQAMKQAQKKERSRENWNKAKNFVPDEEDSKSSAG